VVVNLSPSPRRRGPKLTCPSTTTGVVRGSGGIGLVAVNLSPSPRRRGPKLTCPSTTTGVVRGSGRNSPYLVAGSIEFSS
jgi:hypothetical protein